MKRGRNEGRKNQMRAGIKYRENEDKRRRDGANAHMLTI